MKEKKTNCGIYIIKNILNNKVYVGSSINLKSRKYRHFYDLKNNTHHSIHLQRSFNKYGEDNFKWQVLEYIEEKIKEVILERENFWIKELKSSNENFGYNICPTADNCLGIKHTKETIQKMKESHKNFKHKEETIQKMKESKKGKSTWIKGKKHKEETIQKMKESAKRRPKISEETRNKLKDSHIGIKPSKENILKRIAHLFIKIINLDTNEVFNSITEASIKYNLDKSTLSKVCRGKLNTTGGFRWAYYTEVT